MHSNADRILLDTIHYPNLVRKKNIKVMDVHFSLNEGPNRTHPYTHAISSIQYLNHYGHTPIRDDHK